MAGGFYIDPSVTSGMLSQAASSANRAGQLDAQAGQFGIEAAKALQPGTLLKGYLDRQEAARQQALDEKRQEDLMKLKMAQEGRAKSAEQRTIDELARVNKEREATRVAQGALLDPSGYTQNQLTPEEQAGLATSLANLTPAEAKATQEAVEQDFVNRALLGENVNTNTVADLKNQLAIRDEAAFNKAVRTPGTPEYEAAQKGELDLYRQKKKIASQYDKSAGKTATNLAALAQYGKDLGIVFSPNDNETTVKMKIKNKEKELNTRAEKEKEQIEADKKAAEKKGPLLSEVKVDVYRSKLNIPLNDPAVGFKDSTRLADFLKDSDITNALITNKVRVKDLESMIMTQLKADDDLEDALEVIGKQLTGKSKDF